MKKKLLVPTVIVGVLLVLAAAFGLYFGIDYEAKNLPEGVFQSNEQITVLQKEDYIAFEPKAGYESGLIFYQGAKVEERAYAPLLRRIAEGGVLCVLVKMPLNFAIFDVNAAEEIVDDFAELTIDWYVGGHSLGGSMAAACASENPHIFEGVILFASYSTERLASFDVLSVYGEKDEVLNMEKYEKNKAKLPDDFVEVKIEGGNHANFGYYGKQKGDGEATLSREAQISVTAEAVVAFIVG